MQAMAGCKCHIWSISFLCGCLSGPGQHSSHCFHTLMCSLSSLHSLLSSSVLAFLLARKQHQSVSGWHESPWTPDNKTNNFYFASTQLWSDLWKKIGTMSGLPIPDLGRYFSSTGQQLLSRFYLLQIKIQTCHLYIAENYVIAKPKMSKGHKFLLVLGQGIHSHWNISFRKERFQLYYYSDSRLETWTNQHEDKVFTNH